MGLDLATTIFPEKRSRSIYDVVIYRADAKGRAAFALPSDLSSLGIAPGSLDLKRAELRFLQVTLLAGGQRRAGGG